METLDYRSPRNKRREVPGVLEIGNPGEDDVAWLSVSDLPVLNWVAKSVE